MPLFQLRKYKMEGIISTVRKPFSINASVYSLHITYIFLDSIINAKGPYCHNKSIKFRKNSKVKFKQYSSPK